MPRAGQALVGARLLGLPDATRWSACDFVAMRRYTTLVLMSSRDSYIPLKPSLVSMCLGRPS